LRRQEKSRVFEGTVKRRFFSSEISEIMAGKYEIKKASSAQFFFILKRFCEIYS
jgi:hypothetical protein